MPRSAPNEYDDHRRLQKEDYRNTYDSVIHSWILKTLEMYRFNEKRIKFMKISMSNWNTTMKPFHNDGCITADQIKIKRGIFQGDSFSPRTSNTENVAHEKPK